MLVGMVVVLFYQQLPQRGLVAVQLTMLQVGLVVLAVVVQRTTKPEEQEQLTKDLLVEVVVLIQIVVPVVVVAVLVRQVVMVLPVPQEMQVVLALHQP
tara:strand:- start:364 stop:657 length:294 start_codon:yes stop_codon:yes gene_type:complete